MPDVMSIEVDEEFDPRPPSSPFGLRGPDGKLNLGMIAGIVIAIILVIMLIAVVVIPRLTKKPPAAVATWKPKDPTQNIDFLESYPATGPLVTSLQASLEAWAKFYTTGNLGDLVDTFDLAGNQYAKLVAEQPSVAAAPETPPPSVISLGPVGKVTRKDDIFTVRTVITWTKPGGEGKEYKWDIDMKAKDQRYILNTVRETNPQDKQPVNFCGAATIVSKLDSDQTVEKNITKAPAQDSLALFKTVYQIRVKAWQFLEDATAGSDSANDVQSITDNYRALVDASRKATSLADLKGVDQSDELADSYSAIQSRVKVENCGVDIKNR